MKKKINFNFPLKEISGETAKDPNTQEAQMAGRVVANLLASDRVQDSDKALKHYDWARHLYKTCTPLNTKEEPLELDGTDYKYLQNRIASDSTMPAVIKAQLMEAFTSK